VRTGDLVLFRAAGSRVVGPPRAAAGKAGRGVRLAIKGDRMEYPDGIILAEKILGEVIARERDGSRSI